MSLMTMIIKMSEGRTRTCAIFFLTLIFSLPLGMVVALLRMSKVKIVSAVTRFIITVLRGTPLMLQLLAVTYKHGVEKIRKRLRVKCAGPPGDYKRILLCPFGGKKRYPRKVHHAQDVRVGHLVLKRKSHYVRVRHRSLGLKRIQRKTGGLHGALHVLSGRKDSLHVGVSGLVHYVVEYVHAVPGHAYLVGVRETESKTDLECPVLLYDLIRLVAYVSSRLLDPRKKRIEHALHIIPRNTQIRNRIP